MDSPVLSAPPSSAAEVPAPVTRNPRTTRRRVLVLDKLAGGVIRTGGLMVIVALLGIRAFLVVTVAPLFRSAKFESVPTAGTVPVEGTPRFVALDEYRILAVAVGDAPELVVFRPDDPREVVARLPIPGLEGAAVTAARRTLRSEEAVVGTSDGRLAFLDAGFTSDFLLDERLPALRAAMHRNEIRTLDGGVVQRVAGGNLLRVKPRLSVRGVVRLPAGPVLAAGYATSGESGAAVALTPGRGLWLVRSTVESTPVGPVTHSFSTARIAEDGPAVPADPFAALVDEDARTAWVASHDGALLRVDLAADPAVRREVKLVHDPAVPAARLTAAELLLGGRTVLLGDEAGGVTAWSLVRRTDGAPPAASGGAGGAGSALSGGGDGFRLERFHEFEPTGSAVTSLSAGLLRRTFFVGKADGSVTLCFATNARVLGSVRGAAGPVGVVAAGPKDDGMLVVGPGGAYRGFTVDAPHPETNFRALFRKVHYESYDDPQWTYQSSASTQEAEPKLSLTPLLFGTIKGTFYALLFALPLALLAAIYTSQFMHRDLRAVVKPGIEVMASLPSVVLGFLAALVLAPAIERIVPGLFAALLAVPAVAFLTGCVWHALPDRLKHGTSSRTRLLIALGLVAGTVALCVALRGPIEDAFFGGSFRAWLRADPALGSRAGTGILRVALFLLGALVGFFLVPRLPFLRLPEGASARARAPLTAAYVLAPAALLALGAPWVEDLVFGGDFRRFLVGHGTVYVQLNSLVVGIAMGFAVIPIIYTIAEDALIAIPDSLKSAALACGASPWQTATRVVLPAAIPGVFSAAMIGLGRAIGETMIVVMATGGTAIIDWSMFNGFRTLSNNIATELPEAPVGGTLYRVLFLAGLLLFALTFVVNTVAEVVRIRFRKRFRGL